MYLLDSSFFCIRSYNFVDGERKPCTRCVGGGFEAAEANNCNPFPTGEVYAGEFVRGVAEVSGVRPSQVDGSVRESKQAC